MPLTQALQQDVVSDRAKCATGLRAVIKILGQWDATGEQIQNILRISPSTLARAKRADREWTIALDRDQVTRMSLVLNMHAALRTVFENPDNLYGFMKMANHNEGFSGDSPLNRMASGDILALMSVASRIDAMRGAQW
ncbi:hypothetical protein C8D96_2705 [Kushneria marisflavi]|uniref:DUF2384 domain-containing protein n=2 Tax=Kushneria marisflavi TaxID=157779 RepID=A0A240UMM6_9GAMM|nr:antitoxin Xre-like helix-turn-helix domain-containing protein [Kushneria marisflavi]ART62741.1 hypothetical protein B9H00_06495 [Kushneria marisflavi]RKD83851.1 hypothetical protein C8D96_2705 [Kushneria marisflavi]